jgi:hypothetical protein
LATTGTTMTIAQNPIHLIIYFMFCFIEVGAIYENKVIISQISIEDKWDVLR